MDKIPPQVIAIALAFTGGAVSYIHRWLGGEKFILVHLIGSAIVGGFVGILAFYFLLTTGIPSDSPSLIFFSSAAGAVGYDTIRPMWDKFLSRK